MPNCHNTVGQHNTSKNVNKQVCSSHRSKRKKEVEKWKMDQGCNNSDGHYGFACVTKVVLDPCQLDINHIDGNNDNRLENNIEVLCAMCHRMVTMREQHYKQPKASRRFKPDIKAAGLFTGLIDKTISNNELSTVLFNVK